MDKVPILIIAPFFAPQSHAAMFRVHKLVKYLPDYGYRPIVVTTDINYNYNEDLSLLDEFGTDIEIHTVRYIEPTIRGLRMFFGGKDRTFKSMKVRSSNASPSNITNTAKNRVIKNIHKNIQGLFINSPDAYWTWILPATRKADELIKKNNIRLFYTTANPDSVVKIGLNVKKKNIVKWVADFRDPIGYYNRCNQAHDMFKPIVRKWLTSTMEHADIVTGLSSSYGKIFEDLYKLQLDKFIFIPTGLDEKYIPISYDSDQKNKTDYLIFVGEYQKEYGDYFFKILNKVFEKLAVNLDIELHIVGRIEINKTLIIPILNNYKSIKSKVVFSDHISQRLLYEKIHDSLACVLLTGGHAHWWNNFAKMVDYIALKKNVIADVAKDSEAGKELSKAGLGIFLDHDEQKDINNLVNLISRKVNTNPTNYSEKYLANFQVKSFVNIFNGLIK